MKEIYLDNAATTKTYNETTAEIEKCLKEDYGNPSSVHELGEKARKTIDKARKEIAREINAKAEEIIFTSGATESNNMAIFGLAKANPNKKTIVISEIEHPSLIEPCNELEKRGYNIIKIETEDGIVNINELKRVLDAYKDILLVSVMHVNNIIGTIQPIYEIASLCNQKRILFHTDAVQSFGKLSIDVSKGIDLLSASGHKIGALKGIGFIYAKKGVKIEPLIYGGGQERGLRSGTENVPGIIGFASALNEVKKINKEKIKKLRDKLMIGLEKIGGKINGSREKRIYNNVNVSFLADSDMIVQYLSNKGIYVSSGSACESKKEKADKYFGGVRIVLNEETTEQDINAVVKEIKDFLQKF